jgi:hypothetical protein
MCCTGSHCRNGDAKDYSSGAPKFASPTGCNVLEFVQLLQRIMPQSLRKVSVIDY